jgi:hypothetical protein
VSVAFEHIRGISREPVILGAQLQVARHRGRLPDGGRQPRTGTETPHSASPTSWTGKRGPNGPGTSSRTSRKGGNRTGKRKTRHTQTRAAKAQAAAVSHRRQPRLQNATRGEESRAGARKYPESPRRRGAQQGRSGEDDEPPSRPLTPAAPPQRGTGAGGGTHPGRGPRHER